MKRRTNQNNQSSLNEFKRDMEGVIKCSTFLRNSIGEVIIATDELFVNLVIQGYVINLCELNFPTLNVCKTFHDMFGFDKVSDFATYLMTCKAIYHDLDSTKEGSAMLDKCFTLFQQSIIENGGRIFGAQLNINE